MNDLATATIIPLSQADSAEVDHVLDELLERPALLRAELDEVVEALSSAV